MKNLTKITTNLKKETNSIQKKLVILFLITGSLVYAGTREPDMRDLITIITTDLSNSSFNNEEEMIVSAKTIYYEKLAKAESLIKTVRLENTFIIKKEKVVVVLEVDKNNQEKGSIIFKEIQNQIKIVNSKTLNELLHQPYYANNKMTVEEWTLLENFEIIDFYFEPLCKSLINQTKEPHENTK